MSHDNIENTQAALALLVDEERKLLTLAEKMANAYGGALYPFDLLACGAIKRSLALSSGFRSLIGAKNLTCAAALLRMQLDTSMRFFAGFTVDKPHDYALEIFKGTPVRKLKDKSGKLLTDRYIVSQLAKEYPWVEHLYEKTCEYVHLSGAHIHMTFYVPDKSNMRWEMTIGAEDVNVPEHVYPSATFEFRCSMGILSRYVEGWINTKDNPHVVAQLKQERSETKNR